MAGGLSQRPEEVQGQVEEMLPEEDHLLRPAQHSKLRAETEQQSFLAQDPVPEGVERADPHVSKPVRDQQVHPGLHLLGGLVRECEREDLGGAGVLGGDEVGDPPGDDRGLAGAGAGHDEERSRTVGHGPGLLRGQAVQDAADCRILVRSEHAGFSHGDPARIMHQEPGHDPGLYNQ